MPSPHPSHLLTSSEAAARLGVSLETLYSYVSRRLVTPVAPPANSRKSLFELADVERLAEQVRRRSRRAVAASTLDCGEPVLNSAITRIDEGRVHYRGRDAVGLADSATLEDVAALLWQCPPVSQKGEWSDQAWSGSDGTGPHGWCIAAAARLAHVCPWPSPPETVRLEATRLLRGIALAAVQAAAPVDAPSGPIHAWMAQTWGLDEAGADLLRRALVLCADHELNPSTYAARVVASTRAPLGACVLAGLCALAGPRHGGATDRVRLLLGDSDFMSDPSRAIAAYSARGEKVPGFGQRLYPLGDPRAAALLARLDVPSQVLGLIQAMEDATGKRPNIDFALATLEWRLKLPQGAGFRLFAIGRVVGWIAHVLEQWVCDQSIRPRAVYTGER
ncbi:MAG: citrate synthase family protein [Verrucomicrobia bacterium]|nr:citrate synthase family protein [Verrucomicrobiota bacterium]